MNKLKKSLIGILTAIIILLGGMNLGARQEDNNGIIMGVRTASSTVNSAETMTLSMFDNENYIDYTPNVNTTLTFPASSTMANFLPNVGDEKTVTFRNASSTAAATITFAEGTGGDLQILEATGTDLVLEGLDIARVTFQRKNNSDFLMLFSEYTEQ